MRKNDLWQRAAFTIEASYLVPVILFLLVLVGTAALYLHDRCVSAFDAQAITIQGRMLALGNSGEETDRLEAFLSEEGAAGLLMTTDTAAEGAIGSWKITSSVSGETANAFASLFESMGWPVYGTFSSDDTDWFVDPCALIRNARILLDEDADE